MPSIEQSVKNQFAKVFTSCDWSLFKEMAEINFKEAAFLKKSSFRMVAESKQLLIRNIRKRLLIGVGAELLLKAVYLKAGFAINRPNQDVNLKLPFKIIDSPEAHQLNPNETFTLAQLIEQLKEAALVDIYASAFSETLSVRFSFESKEKGVWRVAL